MLGNKAVPHLNQSGKFSAPSVLSQSSLIFKGGSVHFKSPMRANLVTALAGVAGKMLIQPLADVISDNVINP